MNGDPAPAGDVSDLLDDVRGIRLERERLQSEGRREAEGRRGTGWNELITQMAEEFPAYVTEFEEILAMAPVADARELGILVDHEAAAVEFARLERAGNAKSHAPLHAFIDRYAI